MNFQIAGLPRTGTAWIASVLNLCPDIICVHESADKNVHVPVYKDKHYGQTGSHLLLPKYMGKETGLKVFIERDQEECLLSSALVLEKDIDLKEWRKLVWNALNYKEKADIVITFDNIFTLKAVELIWKEISDCEFDYDKVTLMLNMNIQRHSLEYNFDPEFVESFNESMSWQ